MTPFDVSPSLLSGGAGTLEGRADRLGSVAARLSLLDDAEAPQVAGGLVLVRRAWGTSTSMSSEALSVVAAIVRDAAEQYRDTDDTVARAAAIDPAGTGRTEAA